MQIAAAVMDAKRLDSPGQTLLKRQVYLAITLRRDHLNRTIGVQEEGRIDPLDHTVHRDRTTPLGLKTSSTGKNSEVIVSSLNF